MSDPKKPALSELPPELSMLEPLPPLPDRATEPLPKLGKDQVDPEVFAILGGPEATHVMKAAEPEAPAEATQAIRIPAPAGATTAMPVGEPLPESTCRMPEEALPIIDTLKEPLPDPVPLQTQARPVSQGTVRRATTFPAPRKRVPAWVWIATGLLLVGCGAAAVFLLKPELLGGRIAVPAARPAADETPAAAAEPEIPPALRGYHDKALKGDAAAMRMLGVMYSQGLNVEKNPAEGLKWYRRAADAGSETARKELKALEGLK